MQWVIRSASESGFWNNELGWVDNREHATRFPSTDFSLPITAGCDAEWVEYCADVPRYVFSIGLNVGKAEPADQYARTLGAIAAYLPGVIRIAETVGEWEGVRERTLHVLAESDNVIPPGTAAVGLAGMLRQDAVAYIREDQTQWILRHADGRISAGGSLAEYPIAPGLLDGAPQ